MWHCRARCTPPPRCLRFFSSASNLFDTDTAIHGVASGDSGVFQTKTPVSPNWSINGNPNGGFTMCMLISAARKVSSFRDNMTCTGHYLLPVLEGEVAHLHVKRIHSGNRMDTISVSFVQQDSERIRFTGTFGSIAAQRELSHNITRNIIDENDGPRPIDFLPSTDECSDDLWRRLRVLGIGSLYEKGIQFVVPKTSPFLAGLMQGNNRCEPRIDAHIQFLDGREPCLRSLALFNDCLPPAVLNWAGMAKWVPTLEYTCHFYARPMPGPLRASFRADTIQNGVATINGEIQDSNGNLCSVSRQMCMIRV